MAPLPLAAAASRLAGLLDSPAAPPRTDPLPLGMRAFLAALAPYAATSRIYVLDAAAASRAAAACRAALVGDQTASSALLNAAAALDESSTSTLDAATSIPKSGPLGPFAAASKRFAVDAAAATSHILTTVIGATSGIEAPRRLFSTAASCVDPYTTAARHLFSTAAGCFNPCAVLVVLDAASASQLDSHHSALAAPYSATTETSTRHVFDTTAGLHFARTGTRTRHLFTSAVGLRLPMTTALLHQFFLTRALSTTNKDGMRSKAGARVARQRLKPATKMRRQSRGFKSLDSQLRMSHLVTFSKKNLGRFFLLFTLFTITSQGVGEFHLRIGQFSNVLGSIDSKWLMGRISDVLGSINSKLGLQEMEGTEGWIQLVGIIGEDYGWVEV